MQARNGTATRYRPANRCQRDRSINRKAHTCRRSDIDAMALIASRSAGRIAAGKSVVAGIERRAILFPYRA
jgi:hypothetical protein